MEQAVCKTVAVCLRMKLLHVITQMESASAWLVSQASTVRKVCLCAIMHYVFLYFVCMCVCMETLQYRYTCTLHVECLEGTFGQDCAEDCNCYNGGLCDSVSGACTCMGEWSGPHCNISECADSFQTE